MSCLLITTSVLYPFYELFNKTFEEAIHIAGDVLRTAFRGRLAAPPSAAGLLRDPPVVPALLLFRSPGSPFPAPPAGSPAPPPALLLFRPPGSLAPPAGSPAPPPALLLLRPPGSSAPPAGSPAPPPALLLLRCRLLLRLPVPLHLLHRLRLLVLLLQLLFNHLGYKFILFSSYRPFVVLLFLYSPLRMCVA